MTSMSGPVGPMYVELSKPASCSRMRGECDERQESSLLGEFGPASGLWGFVCSEKSQAVSSHISDWLFKAKDTETTPCVLQLM